MAADSTSLTSAVPAAPPDIPVSEQQIPPFQALVGIITRPAQTFRRLRDSPRGYWWVAFGVTLLMLVLASVATSSTQASLHPAALPAAAASTAAAGSEVTQTAAQPSSALPIALSLAGGAVFLLADYALRAVIAAGMGLVLGGKISFKQAFRMGIWSTVPTALRYLVQSAAMFAAGRPSVSGLSAVLTTAEARSMPILDYLLGKVDFYLLWSIALFAVGMIATARVSRGKGLATAIAYIGVSLAASLLLFSAGNALSSALGSTLGGSSGGGLNILGGSGGGHVPGGTGGSGGGPGGGAGGPPPGG